MESNHWYFAADPIKIDDQDNLIDGQHRLHAVKKSGTTQTFLIVHGLPKEAYNVTDVGLTRKYSDLLRMRKWRNVNNRAALVKLISRWERGVSFEDSRRLTNAEHDELHDKYVDTITRAVEVVLSARSRINMRISTATFAFWLLSQIDRERAYTFFIQLAEGENLKWGMPTYMLRERLHHERDERHTHTYFLYMIFSAWNAFMQGRELTRVSVPNNVQRSQLPELETEFMVPKVDSESDEEVSE
jgi:hypothetical protein